MMVDDTFDKENGFLDITLDSGPDVEDFDLSPENIDHQYIQNTLKGIKRTFVMYDDIHINHSLNVCNPKAFTLNFFRNRDVEKQHVNLTHIDPKPDRSVYIAWSWFFNGLAAIAWAFVIIYVGEYTKFSVAHDAMLPTGILLGTFGVVAFMVFYYKTQDKIIYKSFTGRVPVMELFHMPRNQAYNDFIDTFEAAIYQAQHRESITKKYRLVGELKYLRLMKETGFVGEAEYEKARDKIFGHTEYNKLKV